MKTLKKVEAVRYSGRTGTHHWPKKSTLLFSGSFPQRENYDAIEIDLGLEGEGNKVHIEFNYGEGKIYIVGGSTLDSNRLQLVVRPVHSNAVVIDLEEKKEK